MPSPLNSVFRFLVLTQHERTFFSFWEQFATAEATGREILEFYQAFPEVASQIFISHEDYRDLDDSRTLEPKQ